MMAPVLFVMMMDERPDEQTLPVYPAFAWPRRSNIPGGGANPMTARRPAGVLAAPQRGGAGQQRTGS
jgi:hypothetical protein